MPFSGQLQDFIETLHLGHLCMAGLGPVGKGSCSESWSQSPSAIGSATWQMFYCLVHAWGYFLSNSAHFPRPSDRSEPLLLQSPFSMVQAFIPLPGMLRCKTRSTFIFIACWRIVPSQAGWSQLPTLPDSVLTYVTFNKSQPKC